MTSKKHLKDAMGFQSWTETERLYQVKRELINLLKFKDWKYVTGFFRPKVKLHGTNAGIRIEKDDMGFQGRSRNVGTLKFPKEEKFYDFQTEAKDFAADNIRGSDYAINVGDESSISISEIIAAGGSVTVFGEWAGKGIQNIVACSKVAKFFAPFAIRVNDKAGELLDTIVEPDHINAIIGSQPDWVRVIPWADEAWEIDLTDENSYLDAHAKADEFVAEIEKCDPFVKKEFGVEDVGEGAVFYPVYFKITTNAGDVQEFKPDHKMTSHFLFKVKGDKHQKKHKQKAPVDVEREKALLAFLQTHVPESVLDNLWDPEIFKDPQDIPEWMKTAGPVVKAKVTAALEKQEEYDWKDLKGKVGSFISGYFKKRSGF